MAKAVSKLMTVGEFLAFEGERDTRYQLVRGVVTAMAPAQAVHGELVALLARLIGNRLKQPCRVITEAGIKPAHRDDTYWQADLLATCAPRQPGELYLTAPVLVIEVLSPSTAGIDRTFKLDDYRAIASVQDILLVATDRPRIEHWQRAGDFWQVRDLGPGDVLSVATLGVEIALDELYADLLLGEGDGGGEA